MKRSEIEEKVSEQLIAQLEKGVKVWEKPWHGVGDPLPTNFSTKQHYKGINIFILMNEQYEYNYLTNYWLTFNQAKKLGGNVKKGEKSVKIVRYDVMRKEEVLNGESVEKTIPFLKTFSVFNIDQIENIDFKLEADVDEKSFDGDELIEKAENFIANYLECEKIEIRFGGGQAFYSPKYDYIQMPKKAVFKSNSSYVSTLLHETGHSTGNKSRLNRFEYFDKHYKSRKKAYAAEEVVVEIMSSIASRMLNADHCLENHASYIDSWIELLKSDKGFIFKAFAKATQALDFIEKFNEVKLNDVA